MTDNEPKAYNIRKAGLGGCVPAIMLNMLPGGLLFAAYQEFQEALSGATTISEALTKGCGLLGAAILAKINGERVLRNIDEEAYKLPELEEMPEVVETQPPGFFPTIARKVAKKHGLESDRLANLEWERFTEGTSTPGKGGYLGKVTFTYESGETRAVVLKTVNDGTNAESRGNHKALAKHLPDLVPNAYAFITMPLPKHGRYSRHMYGRSGFAGLGGRGEPLVVDFVPGASLDSIVTGEVPRRDDFSPIFADVPVAEIFEEMEALYKLRWSGWKEREKRYEEEKGEVPKDRTTQTKKLKAYFEKVGWRKKERDEEYTVDPFAEAYLTARWDILRRLPNVEVHQDFHQGNILGEDRTFTKENLKVTDWANWDRGIPSFDFDFFATISDYEKTPMHTQERAKVLERQKANIPELEESDPAFFRFEAYLNLLLKYSTCTPEGEKDNIDNCCKYLLDKSRVALQEYATAADNSEIVGLYETAIGKSERLREIDTKEFDPTVSIAYAHNLFQTERGREAQNLLDTRIGQDTFLMQYTSDFHPILGGQMAAVGATAVVVNTALIATTGVDLLTLVGEPTKTTTEWVIGNGSITLMGISACILPHATKKMGEFCIEDD